MNERNTVILAVLLIAGLAFFNSFDNFSGKYVKGNAECNYISDTSIFNPTLISYDADVNDGVGPKIMKSSCGGEATLINVKCIDGFSPARFGVECPRDHVCVDLGQGGFCKLGSVEQKASGCTDSDGGRDIYVKGVTVVKDGRGKGLDEVGNDICATATTVTETSCAPQGNRIEKIILSCPYPKVCSDGRCA